VGAQGYVKVAIRYPLATLFLHHLKHNESALDFSDETFGSQKKFNKGLVGTKGHVKVAMGYRLATLFPDEFLTYVIGT